MNALNELYATPVWQKSMRVMPSIATENQRVTPFVRVQVEAYIKNEL